MHYAAAGMTLSHHDARAHLVVARRVFDNIFPGWQQIGAVWLPLPHLLNALPGQVDAWYRNGASGIAISVLSMAVAAWSLASTVIRITGSRVAAITGAALLMLNPNVLYLQSTPMTEPLLFATCILAIMLTAEWLDDATGSSPRAAGLALTAACMTRYEAWPITATAIALSFAVMMRRGIPFRIALRDCARLALYPAVAIAIFCANSRFMTGMWLVSDGFFIPENEAMGRPLEAWRQLRVGLYRLSGTALVWSAYAGIALLALSFVRSKARASLVLIVALAAAAAIPIYAYTQGHPFRIRYDVPLITAAAALASCAVALLPALLRPVAAAVIVAMTVIQAPPLDRQAPVIVESHRDARNMEGRRAVTAYLRQHYDGRMVMMSMGSLGHYMHDLGVAGFDIRELLHEGNGEIWRYALLAPHGHAGWIIVEEKAEGGDELYALTRRNPRFLRGFERVAEGGGVALYREARQ